VLEQDNFERRTGKVNDEALCGMFAKRLKRKIPEIGDCGGREFARTLHTEQWEFSHTLFVL